MTIPTAPFSTHKDPEVALDRDDPMRCRLIARYALLVVASGSPQRGPWSLWLQRNLRSGDNPGRRLQLKQTHNQNMPSTYANWRVGDSALNRPAVEMFTVPLWGGMARHFMV